jgi:Peptidase A4 family
MATQWTQWLLIGNRSRIRMALLIGAVVISLVTGASVSLAGTQQVAASANKFLVAHGPNPGTVIHAASCEQAPPQSVKDRATYTAAELARYGLPPRTPGEPFEKWARIVRNQRVRHCDYTETSDQLRDRVTNYKSGTWAGNIADQSTPGQLYTEMDIDYYVPCVQPPYDVTSDESEWIGLGGGRLTPNGDISGGVLLQTGSEVRWSGGAPTYWMWWEDYLINSTNSKRTFFQVGCGSAAHMYLKVWNGKCIYVQRLNDGYAQGNGCNARATDNTTAEAIVERYFTTTPLANFGSVTFHGVGITDNGQYRPMGTDSLYKLPGVPHDFTEMYHCSIDPLTQQCIFTSLRLASVEYILDDPGDYPYDQYTVTWRNAGP